jgi:hypothetical protein
VRFENGIGVGVVGKDVISNDGRGCSSMVFKAVSSSSVEIKILEKCGTTTGCGLD